MLANSKTVAAQQTKLRLVWCRSWLLLISGTDFCGQCRNQTFILEGPMDRTRMLISFRQNSQILEFFLNGFPRNWKDFLMKLFGGNTKKSFVAANSSKTPSLIDKMTVSLPPSKIAATWPGNEGFDTPMMNPEQNFRLTPLIRRKSFPNPVSPISNSSQRSKRKRSQLLVSSAVICNYDVSQLFVLHWIDSQFF